MLTPARYGALMLLAAVVFLPLFWESSARAQVQAILKLI